ncbi:helix-turn-helix domain-containing protein [Pelagibius sp.]|uniref:helix-turn-helix domain-containing protein n=1 Tax=Pelagibius sp. TaxID=1931238 RepID=UPI003B503C6B
MVLAKDVGRCLRALRQQRGLTQAALADAIGRSEISIRAIERGASAPSFVTLEPLTRALDVPAAALFPNGDTTPTTERQARDLAALTALARDLRQEDLAIALDILRAVSRRRNPNR